MAKTLPTSLSSRSRTNPGGVGWRGCSRRAWAQETGRHGQWAWLRRHRDVATPSVSTATPPCCPVAACRAPGSSSALGPGAQPAGSCESAPRSTGTSPGAGGVPARRPPPWRGPRQWRRQSPRRRPARGGAGPPACRARAGRPWARGARVGRRVGYFKLRYLRNRASMRPACNHDVHQQDLKRAWWVGELGEARGAGIWNQDDKKISKDVAVAR